MIGVPVARILGIEVRLQLGWVLVVALVATLATVQVAEVDPTVQPVVQWLLGGVVALGFFVSALAHDLSHAVVARRRGVEVGSIVISFFGGATPQDPTSPNPGHDLAIAVSGPAVSIALGAGLALAATLLSASGTTIALVVAQVLAVLAVLNLILGLVNLVPAYPLDGGRIVRAFAWRRTGLERDGWRASAAMGRATGTLVIVGGAGLILIVFNMFAQDTRSDRVWVFFDEKDVLTHFGATFAVHRTQYALPWEDVHEVEDNAARDADRPGVVRR